MGYNELERFFFYLLARTKPTGAMEYRYECAAQLRLQVRRSEKRETECPGFAGN